MKVCGLKAKEQDKLNSVGVKLLGSMRRVTRLSREENEELRPRVGAKQYMSEESDEYFSTYWHYWSLR